MHATGILDKMPTSFINPVQYFLPLGNDKVAVNEIVGKKLRLQWTGSIFCTVCGRKTQKSFGEGLCYPCFANAPENAECIVRPELCEAHLGKGRDPEWEKRNHFRRHFVYLALTNSVKVGVTRDDQIPTRWIDQGANQGIILAETPYRQIAGLIEVELKKHLSDKTNWQRMLKNEVANNIDLIIEKERIKMLLPDELSQYVSDNNEIVELKYPVLDYPTKVTSVSFEKLNPIEMPLIGIRGQYFIFENGYVFNVRRNSGYEVELDI
ncbi:MAG: DUF2797 domain-containing protein [Chitinophagales bacterium]|nr:DUF2797 domain-containing protein [Chitinophagales bacterium]